MSAEDFSDFDRLTSQDRPPLGPGAVGGSPTDGSGNPGVSVDLSQVSGAEDVQAIELLSGTGYLKRTGTPTWALVATIPWSDISGTPTTLAGYGIVDAQPLDGDLTAIAALTGTNTLYYRSGASAWSPVTIGSGITFSGGTLSAASGSGDFVGPASATDNAIVRFDGTTGKLGQNSLVTISDLGELFVAASSTGTYRQALILQADASQGIEFKMNNTHASGSLKSQLSFYSQGNLKWAFGNDSAENGTDDFWIYQNSASDFRFQIKSDGKLRLKAYAAGTLVTDASGNVTASTTGIGTGDFVGPSSATDNAIVRFDGTTGKLGQNSLVTIDDNGNVTIPSNQSASVVRALQVYAASSSYVQYNVGKDSTHYLTAEWDSVAGNGNFSTYDLSYPLRMRSSVFQISTSSAGGGGETTALTISNAQLLRLHAYGAGVLTSDASGNITSAKVLKPLFDHFADAGNTTTTETDLYSDTIAASQLGTNGDKLELEAGGVFVSSATATRQVKLYFGGTAVFDTGALTLSLSAAWTMFAVLIRVSSSVIRYTVSLTTEGAALAAYTATGELTGLTLSATNTLKITGTAAGVGAATNDIVAKLGAASFIPAA